MEAMVSIPLFSPNEAGELGRHQSTSPGATRFMVGCSNAYIVQYCNKYCYPCNVASPQAFILMQNLTYWMLLYFVSSKDIYVYSTITDGYIALL